MKKLLLILPLCLAIFQSKAQYMIVGKDSVSLADFKKENLYALQNSGVTNTVKSTQEFMLLQQLAAEKKADTTAAFTNKIARREEELREKYFYPEQDLSTVLNNYLADSRTERQVQVFLVQKAADDKNDYGKIYSDVTSGRMKMEEAIAKFTKNNAAPVYIKPGVLDGELYQQLVALPVGGYTKLMDAPSYAVFAKLTATRPSLGYMIFGVLSYPNDASAEALKAKIYTDLKAGKKFEEVTKTYGTTDSEKNNGGAVMGSPILPDSVYDALKGHAKGYYTQPILIDNKYFIFNIYDLEPYVLTDKTSDFFHKEMMTSNYGLQVSDKLIARLKADPSYKKSPEFDKLSQSYQEFLKIKNDHAVLYQYGKHRKTFGELKTELQKIKEPQNIPAEQWKALMIARQNQDLLNYYSEDFDNQKNIKEEISKLKKNLYSEYIFADYLRKEVDGHPEWLTEYYNAHKDKFVWEPRAVGRVALLADNSLAPSIEAEMKDPANWDALNKKYYGKLTKNQQVLVHFEKGEMAGSADIFKKYGVPFAKGIYSAKMQDRVVVVAIDEVLPPSQMSQEEAKDALRDAVTEQVLQRTLESQRAKTKIVVQPSFIGDLEKNFKK